MVGLVLRRQKQRTLPSKCVPHGCPARAERHRGTGAAPRIGKTPPAGLPVPMERVSSPAIDRSGCWCGGAAMRTSLRRIAIAAAAVIAVAAATAALPGTAEARWHGGGWHGGWRGHGGWGWGGFGWGFAPGFAVGFGAPYYGWLLWRPVLRLWGRLRHAPPLGDQPLGSSRLAMDSRLLLDVPFGNLRPASRAEASRFACQPSGVT